MPRSAAAARAPRTHARPARSKPARRASGRAERNAQALRKSATAHKNKRAPAKPTRAKASRAKAARPKGARKPAATRRRGVLAVAAHAGAIALPVPLRVIRAPFTRSLHSRGGGVLDALLQGRGWIGLIAVLLVGIVFFNVDLLKLNRDIAATSQRSSGIERENARLRLEVAKLDGSERVQTAAASHGLLLPAPGDVRYLRANPFVDSRRAAKLIEAPNSSVAAPEPTPQATTPQATTPQATTPQTTTPPATTPQPAPVQPQAAPVAPVQQTQAQPGATTTAPTG
jgi:cell division protein FtsL